MENEQHPFASVSRLLAALRRFRLIQLCTRSPAAGEEEEEEEETKHSSGLTYESYRNQQDVRARRLRVTSSEMIRSNYTSLDS